MKCACRVWLWALLAALGICGPTWGQEAKPNVAVQPVARDGDKAWMDRHQAMNARIQQGNADLLFIGDSITHGWEGDGKDVWQEFYGKRNAVNLGISGDRTQHVLWRLDNYSLDKIAPKLVVIMIGTNNAGSNTPSEIATGVEAIVKKLRDKLPQTKILLLAVFPREEKPGVLRAKLAEVNALIAKLDDGKMVSFLDIGPKFLEADGTLPKSIMPDALHPNEKGYQIWAEAIEGKVAELMGEKK